MRSLWWWYALDESWARPFAKSLTAIARFCTLREDCKQPSAKTPDSAGTIWGRRADVRKAGTRLRSDRMAAILEYVAASGSVDVGTAARELDVSAATLRRDLQVLQEQGLLLRTHGGAVANGVEVELPLRYREARHQSEKRAIGKLAASLVPDRSVVGITGGTTATEVARSLMTRSDITVVTNALNIAGELLLRPSLRIIVIGGAARHASYELVGPAAESMVERYHF